MSVFIDFELFLQFVRCLSDKHSVITLRSSVYDELEDFWRMYLGERYSNRKESLPAVSREYTNLGIANFLIYGITITRSE